MKKKLKLNKIDKLNELLKTIMLSLALCIFILLSRNAFYYVIGIDISSLSHWAMLTIKMWFFILAICLSTIFFLVARENDKYIETMFKGLLAIVIYIVMSNTQYFILSLSKMPINSMPLIAKVIYLIAYEIVMITIIAWIFKDTISSNIVDMKKNNKKYFKECFPYWLIGLVIMMVSNLIIYNINGGGIAGNEESIRGVFDKAPFYTFISAVVFAPIVEELVFRQGLRNIFTSDKVFIIVSGLVFGGLHVAGNVNNWTDLLYLIPYCTPGFIFAYMLTKTKNIFTSMGIHFLHNGIIMSLQVLLLLLT